MTQFDWIVWLACLIVVCAACYMMGRIDGEKSRAMNEFDQLELDKYKIDKYYEFERWKVQNFVPYDPDDDARCCAMEGTGDADL